jgi:predicted permease
MVRRRREFALRVALGLGRGRLAWQLLSEAFVLALIGGAAGVGVAALALNGVRGFVSTMLPDHADAALDPGAMLVTAVLALATGVVFGILPALSVSRVDLQGKLREDSRGASESRHSRRLRGALVAAQIAICVSLLTGAVLLTRSLLAMVNAPLGFEPSRVLTLALQLTPRDYATPAAQRRFYEEFLERLRYLPDVEAAASGTSVPTEVPQRSSVALDGGPQLNQFVLFASVSDDYFRTLRIPLRQGRTFDDRDPPGPGASPAAVISESMARRYWPAGNPVGARMRMGPDPKSPLVEVIGVVGDVRNDLTHHEAEPMVYRSSRQFTWPFARLLLRTKGDPLDVLKSVDRELAALNPGLVLDRAVPLSAVVTDGLAGRRLPAVRSRNRGRLHPELVGGAVRGGDAAFRRRAA